MNIINFWVRIPENTKDYPRRRNVSEIKAEKKADKRLEIMHKRYYDPKEINKYKEFNKDTKRWRE